MSYYTAAGEPPGQWAGKGCATLGLAGQVDPDVIARLYQQRIGPGGQQLVQPRESKAARKRSRRRWPPTWPRTRAPAPPSSPRSGPQGRTVDTAHLLVTDSLSRQSLYVGMTTGRESNTAHVVTGQTAPPAHQSYEQASSESVLAGILQRDDGTMTATERIRQAQDWACGTGHMLTLWSAAVRQNLTPGIERADQSPPHRTPGLAL